MQDPKKHTAEPVSAKVGRPKSTQKRESILDAATDLFLENGYAGTSMDLVSKEANVSKQTVYSHFNNKDTLFSAVIDLKCSEHQLDDQHLNVSQLAPRDVLQIVGQQFINLLLDPQVTAMYRVVISEGKANPHVSELFYQAGPQHAIDMMKSYFLECSKLAADEAQAERATMAFFNLLKGEFHMRSLLGLPNQLTEQSRQEHITLAINTAFSLLDYRG